MTLKHMNQVASEEQEIMALVKWSKAHPICRDFLVHVPNERHSGDGYVYHLKRRGLKATGVPDFFLAVPSRRFGGLWIEMKKKIGGRTSKYQREWIKKLWDIGYRTDISYGWEHAVQIITEYLGDGKATNLI